MSCWACGSNPVCLTLPPSMSSRRRARKGRPEPQGDGSGSRPVPEFPKSLRAVARVNPSVSDEEVRKYYEEQLAKGAYGSVRVSAIYVNYSPSAGGAAAPDGKTTLSEGQARGKAEELLAKLRAGADFAALAREHSDDKSSAEKGGDLGVFSKESRIPTAVKKAVLGLKTGGLSELVQAGGTFYIFKATDSAATPFDEVKGKIETRLRSVMLFRKTQEAQAAVPIEFTDHPMLEERPMPPKTAK